MSNNFLQPKTATLSPVLTSYDFLKTAAIVLMVIDHLGYFFYPEDMWLRALGRLSAPIWFFLIGYAQSRDIGLRMWVAASILLLSNWVTGFGLLPVNIICTMIVFRLLLDPVMNFIARKPSALYPISAILFFIALPSAMIIEYGSVAMLMVMAGYMTRNRESLPFDKTDFLTFCFAAAGGHILYQIMIFFTFSVPQEILVVGGIMAVMLLMTAFKPYAYPALTEKMPAPLAVFLRICGRWSLEIYVFHLIAFKGIAIAIGYIKPHYFSFHIH